MEEKVEERVGNKNAENEGGRYMGGHFIGKQSLWLMAGGALGALAVIGIGKLSKKVRPAAVGVAKEGFTFKEWLIANYEKVKEDIDDIVAEAKHAHLKDVEKTAETVKKEEELLRRVEEKVEQILRQRSKKEEG